MYLLYVDESGDPGPNGSPFLVLGAAAIFEGKWLPLEYDLRALIGRYFPAPPRPSEIHLAELRKGRNEFRTLTPVQRSNLLNDFCQLAQNLLATEFVMFSVIADKQHWFANNAGKTGDDLYAEMFEDLSSRFDLFLRWRYAEGAPNKGIIIADPHKPSLCDALKTNQRIFQRRGHRWDILYNLIETVFFLESDESPGLQFADLAAHALWRLVAANGISIATRIRDLFDREPLGSESIRANGMGSSISETTRPCVPDSMRFGRLDPKGSTQSGCSISLTGTISRTVVLWTLPAEDPELLRPCVVAAQ